MSDSRENLFFHWSDSSQKFDYYVTGLIAAVVVYLTKEYRPAPLGINSVTIELIAIIVLALSLFAGITQIERAVTILRVTHDLSSREEFLQKLRTRDPRQSVGRAEAPDVSMTEQEVTNEMDRLALSIQKAKEGRRRLKSLCMFCYTARNTGLLLGVILMILAKASSPYLGS